MVISNGTTKCVSDQLTYCHSKTSVIHEVSIQCVELFEGHAIWANTVFTSVTIPMCPLQPVIHTVMWGRFTGSLIWNTKFWLSTKLHTLICNCWPQGRLLITKVFSFTVCIIKNRISHNTDTCTNTEGQTDRQTDIPVQQETIDY